MSAASSTICMPGFSVLAQKQLLQQRPCSEATHLLNTVSRLQESYSYRALPRLLANSNAISTGPRCLL